MAETSPISFSGIASGLDTNAIIGSMLKVDQARIDGLRSQRSVLETQISVVGQLRGKVLGFQSKLDALRFQSQLFTRSAATDTPSGQPTVVGATANSSAQVGSFKVWVDQLATATKRVGGASIGDQTFLPNAAVASSGLVTPPTAGRFTINGVSIDATGATTMQQFVNAINNMTNDPTTPTGVIAELVDNAGNPSGTPTKLQLRNANGSNNAISLGSAGDTSNFLTATKLSTAVQGATDRVASVDTLGRASTGATLQNARLATPLNATGSFTINGVSFSYDAAVDTLGSIIGKINGSAANVAASYDAVADQITLTSKQTGAQSISVADSGGGNLMAALKLTGGSVETLGQNALFRIDAVAGGAQQSSTSNQVSGVVAGVTLDLKQQSAAPVTVTIAQDTSKPLAAMKDFVSALNDLQDFIKTNTGVDAKGNPGALKGNLGVRLLSDALRRMTTDMVSGMSGPYESMADIGVSTGPVGSAVGTTNSFQVDEAKFNAALAANPQAVYDLLNNTTAPAGQGVFARMRGYLASATLPGGLVAAADSAATARESDIDRQVARLTEAMASKQKRLQMQFASMESAISQLQAQGQRMQAQLGSGK
ncbi:MAG TPA: flagellar filament capping protein FliD [Chloroflexota bacterium]